MKNNDIKVLSSVYPSDPLPFNEWIKFVHMSSEKNARKQVNERSTKQPANFNEWVHEVHNAMN